MQKIVVVFYQRAGTFWVFLSSCVNTVTAQNTGRESKFCTLRQIFSLMGSSWQHLVLSLCCADKGWHCPGAGGFVPALPAARPHLLSSTWEHAARFYRVIFCSSCNFHPGGAVLEEGGKDTGFGRWVVGFLGLGVFFLGARKVHGSEPAPQRQREGQRLLPGSLSRGDGQGFPQTPSSPLSEDSGPDARDPALLAAPRSGTGPAPTRQRAGRGVWAAPGGLGQRFLPFPGGPGFLRHFGQNPCKV